MRSPLDKGLVVPYRGYRTMQDGHYSELGRILHEEGRKQTWLAERSGIHPSRLNQIVRGLHPAQHEAEAIASALGRKVGELWPERTPA